MSRPERLKWAAGETPRRTEPWFHELGTGKAAFCATVDEDGTLGWA